MMIKAFLLLIAIAASLPATVIGKPLDKPALLRGGGQVIQGTVSKIGVFGFHIKTAAGDNLVLSTDRNTLQFVPKEERLMIGDRISVVYFAPVSASGYVEKNYAFMVEFITRVDRTFLDGDITCILGLPKFQNGRTCQIKETGQLIRFEGRFELDPYLLPGDPFKINIKAIPARIGNGYIYKGSLPDE